MCIRDRVKAARPFRFIFDEKINAHFRLPGYGNCLLYTSDAADDLTRVDFGGRRLFQGEDGIRDLVRSLGLGDVYKRQGKSGPAIPFYFRRKDKRPFPFAGVWE